ncbi:MAG: YdeI/OmpD-associated family protein [Bacteroidota bacterium]
MPSFSAKIFIIGVNPYVLLPAKVLNEIFKQAGKDKGAIQIKGTLNGHPYEQNLVKYSGKWRLYLNMPMRKAAGIDVGDMADVVVEYDAVPRIVPMHPRLQKALNENAEAKAAFDALPPSRQKEILRYISFMKTEASLEKNINRAIQFLLGKQRFIGRDK